ncbi:NADH-ubiquinone oxidoreductase complex I, 21 kDa subunit-domain-containing protein [Paraphysoderma sedebokerense]|nr:NADH-ubiquinone oxidoreductase complex I, 21 kDa subunit-domain-containing protein [Paraphysoderma sedebokerense]
MPFRDPKPSYPIIDTDPHFNKIIRYMRPSDYGVMLAGTAAFPLGYYWLDMQKPLGKLPAALKITGFLGFCGGFLMAYQRSSYRFWGWTENSREINLDKQERDEALALGKSHYKQSTLEPYLQSVAARHSRFMSLKFSIFPWFNVVHHNLGVNQKLHEEQ